MKIKEKLFIVAVFIVAFMSFTLPKTAISLQEDSLFNQVNRLESDYFSTNSNEIYSLPNISDLEEFCNIFVYGEKNKAETIPTNEKSPLVLIELMQAEIAQLQESSILPNGSFNVTDTPTPFMYTLGERKTVVWEYSLSDDEDNILTIVYHSGVEKIVGLDYYSSNYVGLLDNKELEILAHAYLFDWTLENSGESLLFGSINIMFINEFSEKIFDPLVISAEYLETGFNWKIVSVNRLTDNSSELK